MSAARYEFLTPGLIHIATPIPTHADAENEALSDRHLGGPLLLLGCRRSGRRNVRQAEAMGRETCWRTDSSLGVTLSRATHVRKLDIYLE